jgi:hypothetical protein
VAEAREKKNKSQKPGPQQPPFKHTCLYSVNDGQPNRQSKTEHVCLEPRSDRL